MKPLYPIIMITAAFNSVNGFTTITPGKKQVDNKPTIEVVFNNGLRYTELAKIKENLLEKGVSIEYSKLEFDKKLQLKKIEFVC